MNDTIVKALIQAAAIFAQYDKYWTHNQIISYFEKGGFDIEIQHLIKHFEKYFSHYQSIKKGATEELKPGETPIESLLIPFCQQLSYDLVKSDRVVFFISLIELLKTSQQLNTNTKNFLVILAKELKLDSKNIENLLELVISDGQVFNSDFLIVSNNKNVLEEVLEGAWVDKNKPKDSISNYFLDCPHLKGEIIFLKLLHFSFLVFVYHGKASVLLNNSKIIPGKLYIFNLGDVIYFSDNETLNFHDVRSVFRSDGFGARLYFEGRKVCTKPGTNFIKPDGIQPFSFTEESGSLVCISGPKDATSKITDYLSGASLDFDGEIFLNKYNYKTEYYKIQKLLGVVASSPIYDSNLSVYQNVYLITKLFYFGSNDDKIKKHSEEIIERFHLKDIQDDYVKDTKTATFNKLHHCLLNLACAFISDPFILLVDSILEDLSASDSDYVMQILRRECTSDRLIFITTTGLASSTFKYADRLWIFDELGYIIFNGFPKEAFGHFLSFQRKIEEIDLSSISSVVNPDQITQIIHQKTLDSNGISTLDRRVSPKEWNSYYNEKNEVRKNESGPKKLLPVNNISIPNASKQFGLFLGKIQKSKINNIRSTVYLMAVTIFLATAIGLMYRYDWGNTYYFGLNPNIHLYFISAIVVLFILGFIKGFMDTQKEKYALAYLSFNGISSISYMNALLVWLLIYSAIVSIVFAMLGKLILAFQGVFLNYCLIFFSISLLANLIGVLLAISKRKIYKAYRIFVVILCFNLVFSGVFIDYHNLPRNLVSTANVPLIAEFSLFRWAFESLVVDNVKNNNFEKIFYDTDNSLENSYFAANFLIPELQVQLNTLNNLNRFDAEKIVKAVGSEISLFPNISNSLFPFEYVNELKEGKISPQLVNETLDYLTYTQLQFFDRIREITDQRNKLEKRLKDSLGNENYQKFALQNNNLYLKSFLNGYNTINKVSFNGECFVKSMNPIYLQPQSNYGKAQLYAPVKRYNGYYYESIWFNLLVLSIFVLLFYTILLIVSQRHGLLIVKDQ